MINWWYPHLFFLLRVGVRYFRSLYIFGRLSWTGLVFSSASQQSGLGMLACRYADGGFQKRNYNRALVASTWETSALPCFLRAIPRALTLRRASIVSVSVRFSPIFVVPSALTLLIIPLEMVSPSGLIVWHFMSVLISGIASQKYSDAQKRSVYRESSQERLREGPHPTRFVKLLLYIILGLVLI